MCSSFTQRKIFRLTEGFWTFFFSLILKEKVTMKVSHFIMKLIYLNKKFLKNVWVLLLFPCQCQYSANVNTPVHDISFTAQWAAVPLSDVVVKEHRGHSDQDAVVSQFLLKWEWVQVDSERGITVLKEKRRVNWHTDLQRTLDMNYSYNWQSDKPNYFIFNHQLYRFTAIQLMSWITKLFINLTPIFHFHKFTLYKCLKHELSDQQLGLTQFPAVAMNNNICLLFHLTKFCSCSWSIFTHHSTFRVTPFVLSLASLQPPPVPHLHINLHNQYYLGISFTQQYP